jgi:hypothetical protein
VRAHPALSLYVADEPTPGVLSLTRVPLRPQDEQPQLLREWSDTGLLRRTFCVQAGPTLAYAPQRAVDGYLRPYAGPHMWVSAPLTDTEPAWLRLDWEEPVRVGRVEVIADDDVNEDLINLHHHRTPFEVLPTLLRDYRVEALAGGEWQLVALVTGNRRRRIVHELPHTVAADAVRVVVSATNGAPRAHIVAVRVYES